MAIKNKVGFMVGGFIVLSMIAVTNVSAWSMGENDNLVVLNVSGAVVNDQNGLENVISALPVFGTIMVMTGVMAFVVTRKK